MKQRIFLVQLLSAILFIFSCCQNTELGGSKQISRNSQDSLNIFGMWIGYDLKDSSLIFSRTDSTNAVLIRNDSFIYISGGKKIKAQHFILMTKSCDSAYFPNNNTYQLFLKFTDDSFHFCYAFSEINDSSFLLTCGAPIPSIYKFERLKSYYRNK